MMDKNTIIKELNKIASENNVSIKISDSTMNKTIKELGADSLQLLELVMSVEEKFKITLPDEELSQIKTANDLIETILKNLK